MGKLLLSPTRTYAPLVKKLIEEISVENIHGLIHCSGGGQTKILHFIEGLKIVKDNMLEIPPLFQAIKEQSGADWKEMYQVFNMGHRLEVYLPESLAGACIELAGSFNIEAGIIGHVESSKGKELSIKGPEGYLTYG